MLKVQANIEVVTPMFSAGPDPTGGPAEFRIPELKAAMRFWWRAFQPNMPITDLKDRESRIFGLTENAGFRIAPCKPLPRVPPNTAFDSPRFAGVRYLWYYCLRVARQEGRSAWIKPNTQVELTFQFTNHSQAVEALTALWLAEQFGSLGYRARKAAGCFRISRILGQPDNLPTFLCNRQTSLVDHALLRAHYEEGLQSVSRNLGTRRASLPTYTAVTSNPSLTSLLLSNQTFTDWERAVDFLGTQYREYRDHTKGTVNPALAADLHRFADTGTLSKGRNQVEKAALGLPILFRFRGSPNVKCEPSSSEYNRRASPLFFHVGKAGEQGPWWANVSLLWSAFLPRRIRVRLRGKVGTATVTPPPDANYACMFLNSLITNRHMTVLP